MGEFALEGFQKISGWIAALGLIFANIYGIYTTKYTTLQWIIIIPLSICYFSFLYIVI